MTADSFIASIKGKGTTVYQNTHTGLFYTIENDGRHTPVDYNLIKTQTTGVQRLKYWRNRYGYTQADLARLVHVSSKTVIMMWEAGLRHPSKENRQRIHETLGYDVFHD